MRFTVGTLQVDFISVHQKEEEISVQEVSVVCTSVIRVEN